MDLQAKPSEIKVSGAPSKEENKMDIDSKDGGKQATTELNPTDMIKARLESRIWRTLFDQPESQVGKLIESYVKNQEKPGFLTNFMKAMGLHKSDNPFDHVTIGGSKDIVLAIILQNLMHPKNSQRTGAITQKWYKEIRDQNEACLFLYQQLETNYDIEMQNRES